MLTVVCNNNYKTEREYICNILLNEFLGIEYEIAFQTRKDWLITNSSKDAEIVLPDILFQTPSKDWLTKKSLPDQPLKIWDISRCGIDCLVVNNQIPIIFGNVINISYGSKEKPNIPVDIFGSAFFMLTCYEEIANEIIDLHGRFPATASISFQEDFLDRPIINEYIEILWGLLKKCWPNLKRKKCSFRIFPSHDVDIPFKWYFLNSSQLLRTLGADLIVRKNPQTAFQNLMTYFKVKINPTLDPYNNFDFIMNLSEKHALKSTFYFMGGGGTQFDPLNYQLNHPIIKDIIRNIYNRGHEIGFHPSYASATREDIWNQEHCNLRTVIPSNSITSGRQHYLRSLVPFTWRFWDINGLKYDSSLGYADHSGFRCGICYEYTLFDLINRKQLNIKEKPLIVMDCSVMDERYMNMGATQKAFDYMNNLKSKCKMFNGDFTLLWHNDRFQNKDEINLYEQLISQ